MTDALGGLASYTGRAKVNDLGVVIDNEKKGVTVDDFLNLMVAQLQNQDFMNPVEDTQFVSQMAQFASMQSMQEMNGYMKTNYVLSLIGQEVTAAKYSVSGNMITETGAISKISLVDNEFAIFVNDQKFTLEQIMEYHNKKADSTPEAPTETPTDNNPTDVPPADDGDDGGEE